MVAVGSMHLLYCFSMFGPACLEQLARLLEIPLCFTAYLGPTLKVV